MQHNHSFDLFNPSARPAHTGFTRKEADAVVMRARNAALQKPLNHLEGQRNRFAHEGVELFSEINPMQVAQQFLHHVGEHMLDDGLSTNEAELLLAEFISTLKVKRPLNHEQSVEGARKIIDVIRNGYDGSSKFTEFYHDPYTGERNEFTFELVVRKQRRGKSDAYKLTENGAKLLLLNWAAPADIDMIGLFVEKAFKDGQYDTASSHLDQIKHTAINILARLSDIESEMARFNYEKGFEEEIGFLIGDVDEEIDKYESAHAQFAETSRWAKENRVSNDAEHAALKRANAKLDEMFQISSRMKTQLSRVIRRYQELQQQLMAEAGLAIHVHDIPLEFLEPLAISSVTQLEAEGFCEAVYNAILPAQIDRLYDPFAVIDRLKLSGDQDTDDDEDTTPTPISDSEASYSPGQLINAHKLVEDFILEHPEGVTLSQLADAIANDEELPDIMKQCAMHQAVLFSPSDDYIVTKTPVGGQVDNKWIENEFFDSADHVIKLEPRIRKNS